MEPSTAAQHFFSQADEVYDLLVENVRTSRVDIPKVAGDPSEADLIRGAAYGDRAKRALLLKLCRYDREVLSYVSQHLKQREGVVSKRVTSAIGQSRANGVLGAMISAFVGFTVANMIGTWFPGLHPLSLLTLALALAGILTGLISTFVVAGHEHYRLLYYADLIDMAVTHYDTLHVPLEEAFPEERPKTQAARV